MAHSGSRAAPDDYVAWVSGCRDALLRSAYLLTGDAHLAEDLLQDALIKVAKRWDRLRSQHPTAYARRIIYHDHASFWRRRRELPADDLHQRADRASDSDRREAADPADHVSRSLLVRDALDGLTTKQRAVIVLRYFDDLTEAETARTLGVSLGTIKSQHSAALQRLRAHRTLGALIGEET